jgi:hypothetical protein
MSASERVTWETCPSCRSSAAVGCSDGHSGRGRPSRRLPTDSVGVRVTRCPRCDSSRIGHLWRTDMARLTLIDEWKCLDTECGHRWATSVTFAQLQDSGGVPSRTFSRR